MRHFIVVVTLALVVACASLGAAENQTPAPASGAKPVLVGIEYFGGWWKDSPNKWEYRGKDWRLQYPDRIPLLGEYNSQETMDREIKAAAEHGVDFFSILWYPGIHEPMSHRKVTKYLDTSLDHFMKSSNSGLMKFMVELTNHAPFSVITDADWDACMDVCIKAMKHPSYLRVDGRSVMKIHSCWQFYDDCGSTARCKQVLQRLRLKAKEAGIGELLIAIGTGGTDPIGKDHYLARIGEIDSTMQYMDVPNLPQKESDYPYQQVTALAKKSRDARKHDALPYVPYLPVGWNPKPWHDPRPSFLPPTRQQWKDALEEIKSDLLKSPNLGFSKKDGTTQKAFTIYAWNEFGEGGFVAPTKGDQFMKLEVIKEVFGK